MTGFEDSTGYTRLEVAFGSSGPSDGWLPYAEAVLSATRIEDVWHSHCQKMAEFGFDRMIYGANQFRNYGAFGDPSDWLILTNHDRDYVKQFFGNLLYNDAPMTVWVAQNTGVCSWQWAIDRRARGESSQKENMIHDFNERMGVVAGYSISFEHNSPRSKSGIGLCARRGLTQADVEEIWADKGREIVAYNKLMNLKVSSLPFARNTSTLTARQREVLQWVADGKTVQDIATILGLTPATVEKHLRLARENLDAETTAQAVMKASLQNQLFVVEGVSSEDIQRSGQLMAKQII